MSVSAATDPNNGKTFFLDQSNLLIAGALSFLASFAVNSFVQSVFEVSVPVTAQNDKWQLILYNFIYVVIVVVLAIAIMYPLARAKAKRDKIRKDAEALIPSLVKCVNCSTPSDKNGITSSSGTEM